MNRLYGAQPLRKANVHRPRNRCLTAAAQHRVQPLVVRAAAMHQSLLERCHFRKQSHVTSGAAVENVHIYPTNPRHWIHVYIADYQKYICVFTASLARCQIDQERRHMPALPLLIIDVYLIVVSDASFFL